MMKKVCCLLLAFATAAFLCAGTVDAGRTIATRYLNLAINAMSYGDYDSADSLAVTGLSYDETIPDFWFIRAKAAVEKGLPAKNAIEYLEKAVTLSDWLKYSNTNAILMLAELYYKTGSYNKCLSVLQSASKYVLPQAYYLEAASLYAINREKEARTVISFASSLFPDNAEFLTLFFKSEFEIIESNGGTTHSFPYMEGSSGEISRELLKRVYSVYESDPTLLLYAAFFAEQEEAERFLKLYAAGADLYGYDIFYPYVEMRCGFLSVSEAFKLYLKIADGVFQFDMLQKMALAMADDEARNIFQNFLADFSGIITFCTRQDSVYNLSCKYSNGRPEKVSYDRNNDGILEWTMECDFGTPIVFTDSEHNLVLKYHSFPSIKTAEFKDTLMSYSFVPFTMNWTPLNMEKASFSNSENPFFIPIVRTEIIDAELVGTTENSNAVMINEEEARSNANQLTIPVGSGTTVTFSLYKGQPVRAFYYVNGKEFADAVFENGVLSVRNVDMDRDGIKEIKEVYTVPKKEHTEAELNNISEPLFGNLPYKKVWLSELFIDTDGDSTADYRTLYSEDGWTHTFWGIDGMGGYESSYSENPSMGLKESQFYHPLDKVLITVVLRNDKLITVTIGKKVYSAFYDEKNDFYWIYDRPSEFESSLVPEQKQKSEWIYDRPTEVENSLVPTLKKMLDEKGSGLNVTVTYNLDIPRIDEQDTDNLEPDGQKTGSQKTKDKKYIIAEKTCGVYFGVILYDKQ